MTNPAIEKRKKIIYIASGLAVFSMFLPWTILGMRSDTGWEQDYFFVLVFWAYPFFNAHGNNNSNTISKILIICSGLGLIRFINPLEEFVVLGEIYSWRVGAGSYIYLVAWLTGMYGEFIFQRDFSKYFEKIKLRDSIKPYIIWIGFLVGPLLLGYYLSLRVGEGSYVVAILGIGLIVNSILNP